MVVGSESGTVPRVPGVSGVMTSVWRCQESAGCIGDDWKVAGKWGILLHYHTESHIILSLLRINIINIYR